MIEINNEHRLPLTDLEVEMLISSYETKLRNIVKPLQKFETGLETVRYKDDNGLKQCYAVNFISRMNDHNYRVGLGTPDPLTDVVYTKKYINYMRYKDWYIVEIRHKYNECYARLTQLAQYVGYDYSHLVGHLNFTESEVKSMNKFCEDNAYVPGEAPPDGYFQNGLDGRDVNWQI